MTKKKNVIFTISIILAIAIAVILAIIVFYGGLIILAFEEIDIKLEVSNIAQITFCSINSSDCFENIQTFASFAQLK